jgi:hypothetical protein
MLILAGVLFQFPGFQSIQAAPAPAASSLSVSPGSVSLSPLQTQQFTARTLGGLSLGGLITTDVAWTLSPAVGSITAAGLYTAPASISSSQTVAVTATSIADPTKSATATVTLNPPLNVTVAPASVTLTQFQTQTFTAAVTNTGNTAVTWSISPLVGRITAAGLYTAPASIASSQAVTVTATSVADPTKSATAAVTLTPPVSVTVAPASVTLTPSQTQSFSASVTNTSNTAVTWSLNPSIGAISFAGLYTAPASISSSLTVTVTATSVADPTKSAVAIVTLNPPVGVTVAPASVTLTQSQTQTFSATVTNTGNTAITWSISPVVGSITAAGLYTAPASISSSQTVAVTATSIADPTKSATATVTLNPAVHVTVAPASVTLTPSQTQTFSATVINTGNTAVTWSLSPSVGTISSAGLYTAPASIPSSQTVTVTATSVADPNKSATAAVTLNPPVGVMVAPASATLTQSQTQSFSATVTNTSNTAVTWSLIPVVGNITAAGLYTAPASIASSLTVTVTATSVANPTVSAGATVTLNPPVQVTVAPASVTLTQSQTQTFSATVTNTGNTAVTWSISPLVGSISAAGLYTAPASIASSQTVTVTATSVANPTVSAGATVTLKPPVNVTVSPASATLTQSQTQTFSATVTNTGNTAVTWSLSPLVGSITATGLYTAPASIASSQTVTVTATSVADPSKTATAAITLLQASTVSISPSTVRLAPSGTQQFTATVSGSSLGLFRNAVTWTINPSVGAISSAGLYTAPASIAGSQTVTVTATSVADPTKSASASVTITSAVTISVTPAAATMLPSQGQTFTATVGGTSLTGVTWSITPATGTISSGGLYTAPSAIASTSSVTVAATSVADTTKSASAMVTLIPPLQITTTSLPGGTAGTAYNASLVATGGVAPYTWTVASGLPAGLSLSATGTISGTPMTAGSYNVTVKVTDAAAYQATAVVAIVIAAAGCQTCGGLGISTASVPGGTVGSAYSATLAASGGTSPYTWSISAGQLPPGLSLASTTGVISGSPSSAGSYSFTAMVTDSASSHNTASQAYTLTIGSTTLVTDNFNRPNGPLGANWTTAFGTMAIHSDAYVGASSGDAAAFWNANSFTANQYSQATVSITDFASQAGVMVRGSSNTGYFCSADVHDLYLTKLVSGARNGLIGSNTYIYHAGDVIRLDAYGSTLRCLVNGTVILTATDTDIAAGQPGIYGYGNTQSASGGNWTADNSTGTPIAISLASFPNALINTSYSQIATASNGTPPYTWSITAGSLPTGITMSGGVFSGTPTVLGTSSFTVGVQDSTTSTPKSGTFPLTITVTTIDAYGGNVLIHCPNGPAARFYTQQIGSHWWLCTPLGNAMWMQGLLDVGPQSNAITKYGTQANANIQTLNRVKSWGFNYLGTYGFDGEQPWNTSVQVPTTPMVRPCAYGMSTGSTPLLVVGTLDQQIKDLAHVLGPYYPGNPNGMCDWGDLTRIGQALTYEMTEATAGAGNQNFAEVIQGLPGTASALSYIIGIFVEDSDQTWAYFGSVTNNPFDTQPDGRGAYYGGFLTSTLSPYEQADVDHGGLLFKTDQTVYTKKAWHDFLVAKYGTIAALNTAWGSSYTTFGTSSTTVTGEALATTDGSAALFTHTLANAGAVSPNTIQIYEDGTMIAGDCYHANYGDACNPISGTVWGGIYGPTAANGAINYTTKVATVGFAGAFNTTNRISCSTSGTPSCYAELNPDPEFTVGNLVAVRGSTCCNDNSERITGKSGPAQCSDSPTASCETYTYTNTAGKSGTEDYYGSPRFTSDQIAQIFPPAAGHVLTVNYQVNGWMAGGTGLMDEDGRPAHSGWIGTDGAALTTSNPNTATDMRAGMYALDYAYFSAMKSGVDSVFTNAGYAAPMYLGPDTLGTWTSVPSKETLQAASTTVDMAEMGFAAGYTLTQPMLNFVATYYGRPILGMLFMTADADSQWGAGAGGDGDFATQTARGAAYVSSVQSMLSGTSTSGFNPYIGFLWQQYVDSEGTNWGLVTLKDNAYDGYESVKASVTCSPPTNSYICGGEAGNYGNVISSVIIANGLWRLIGH